VAGLKVSVVVPTRNRHQKLQAVVDGLVSQAELDAAEYELIVVDDGSDPPVEVPPDPSGPSISVHRLEGEERSVARNRGAELASGELLVFLDDDMRVEPGFLWEHWRVHATWPDALQFGPTPLPAAARDTPFGRFRQELEDQHGPSQPRPVETLKFATAQNMGIPREWFVELGGFDPRLTVAEDRDLAIRHMGREQPIVFVPSAVAVHDDAAALDIASYCDRAERYMQELVRFGKRHPDLAETAERAEINGPLRLGHEPRSLSLKKLSKSVLMWPPVRALALASARMLERISPHSRFLDKLYRTLLGAYLQRGYRRGLRSTSA
jgi:GT2 family glycosyltransferase